MNSDSVFISNISSGTTVDYYYTITNTNGSLACMISDTFKVTGIESPNIESITSIIDTCTGLYKLNISSTNQLKIEWKTDGVNSSIDSISKSIVRLTGNSIRNLSCKVSLGVCSDAMTIPISATIFKPTSDTNIKAIYCKDSVLLFTNLPGCHSWFFIDPNGNEKLLMDTTAFILLGIDDLKLNKYFVRAYDCNGKDCGITSLFHRSSSNEEHCQDFLHPNVKLFPNPNNGSFTLIVDEFPPGLYMLKVFDLLGRELYQSESVLNSKNAKLDYQLESNLASGMYFVSFGNGSGIRFTIPILITK
ncbi:MAG: T9SS type A sorting domain-containing protein [Saprospiraceae bacterium]|nr:T9SS type A sorting domain-containing protein [Candidatus Defluviibacterium haderslevense]